MRLLFFINALLLASLCQALPVAPAPSTNAEAFRLGLPLPRPRSVLHCPPGGCDQETLSRHNNQRKRAAAAVSPTTTTSSPAETSSASVCAYGENLQKYTPGIAGILAPPVCQIGNYWYQSGQQYNFPIDAINQSCYVQMDKCQLAANQGGNVEPLTVANCNGWQIQACLAQAQQTVASL